MRERAVATIAIWAAVALSVQALIGSLTYVTQTLVDVRTINPTLTDVAAPVYAYSTQVMSGFWQFTAAALMMALITAAAIGTLAIWRGAGKEKTVNKQAVERAYAMQDTQESLKLKRDQRARLSRLISQMDEDDTPSFDAQRYTAAAEERERVGRR
ncbi:MAG: hypothetical protein U0670_04810 [Anaerolineae bacterium]